MKKLFLFLILLSAILSMGYSETIIVDNDSGSAGGFTTDGTWHLGGSTGYNGGTYLSASNSDPLSHAIWVPTITTAGLYDVTTALRTSSNRSRYAPIKIIHAMGTTELTISMYGTNKISQIYIGKYYFNAGTSGKIILSNEVTSGAVIADTMIFVTAVNSPPVISNLLRNPYFPTSSDNVNITANVTDDTTLTLVTLKYTDKTTSTSSSIQMFDDGAHNDTAAGDHIFGASIPPQPDGDVISYYIEAKDESDHTTNSSAGEYTVGALPPPEYRVIWADSWNASFLNESQARTLVDTCRNSNINTIMIEVRKIGDAYYDSSIEPRATNISGGATFDPLEYLTQYAHDTTGGKKYINIHGWFVMHRISKGETLDTSHVLTLHPEYIMSDSAGNTNGSGSYFLDPGHPGTPDHNISVILDCLQKYDIDGINLDYIRYPEATGDWGYNPVSVQRFNDFYGKTGNPAGSDPDWDAWRRECVTNEVRKLYVKAWKIKPNVVLTADTVNWGSNYTSSLYPTSDAYAAVFQDWVGWLNEGIIDYNALMNYSTTTARYQGWTNLSLANDNKRGSIIGIGAYLQTSVQNSMNQLLYARTQGAAGMNIYDWGSEVDAAGSTRTEFYNQLKLQVYPYWADAPEPEWKTNPVFGVFEGTVTAGGTPVDHATVVIDGVTTNTKYSDGSGWFGALEMTPGTHQLTFSKTGYTEKTIEAVIPNAGDIITVNFDFLTATPTPTPTPEASPTPVETETPTPTPTPEETTAPTPTPEITPTPDVTPVQTETPTPTPDVTPEPTSTPEVTPTPEITPTPSVTPEPTSTPEVTPTPTETPNPVEHLISETYDSTDTWQCWSEFSSQAPSSIAEWKDGKIQCKWPVFPLPAPGFFQWLKWNDTHTNIDYNIGYKADSLYVLRARMNSDKDTDMPQIRLRTQVEDNVWTAAALYGADNAQTAQSGAPTAVPSDFYLVWQPAAPGVMFYAVDIFNARSSTGIVEIDQIDIYRMPVPAADSEEATIDNFAEWVTLGTDTTVFSDRIEYRDTNTYSLAGQYVTLVNPIEKNSVYRLKYSIARDSAEARADQLRMRVADTYNGAYNSNFVFSDYIWPGYMTIEPKEFYLYHWAMNQRADAPQGDLTVFLDTINQLDNAAGIILTKIVIEKISVPTLE